MRIGPSEIVTGADLAEILEGNEGAFLCQQAGKTFVAITKRGHSITSLRSYGKQYLEPASLAGGTEQWTVQRLPLTESQQQQQS